jgi:tmRNA-binding protein
MLVDCHIQPYEAANRLNKIAPPPQASSPPREIKRLTGKIQSGPDPHTAQDFSQDKGLVKIEFALGKGKKVHEKREAIKTGT